MLSSVLFLLSASPLSANAGIPMLFVIYPGFLLTLIPVVFIEAFYIAKLWRDSSFKKIFISVLSANLISTIIGVPLVWAAAVAIQMLFGGGAAHGIDTISGRLYAAVVQAPWLIPYEKAYAWLMPSAFTVLMIYFFLASWLTEYLTVYLFFKKVYDKKIIIKTLFKANLISYIFLYVCGLIYWAAPGFK